MPHIDCDNGPRVGKICLSVRVWCVCGVHVCVCVCVCMCVCDYYLFMFVPEIYAHPEMLHVFWHVHVFMYAIV